MEAAQQPAAEPIADEHVAIHQPVAAEQQALTEQQLNEQIQNLNKLLAYPYRGGHRNEEIFQLLKKVNNSAPNRLVIGFDKRHHWDENIFIIGGEIEGDYDPKSDECKCDYNDPYHHKYKFKLSDVQHVHIVSPLENKLYCTPHNFSIFGDDNSWKKYENAKLKMNGFGVRYCLDYGYSTKEVPASPRVHEFPDGSKFIEGIEVEGIVEDCIIVKDGENITKCPGVIYKELKAHPEPFKINHCNGYTENDYRKVGTLCLKYYTGNSATDPDRGYYCLNNNDELVKCGDLPNDFEFKHDILNEVFCLGKYAQQPQQPAAAEQPAQAQQPAQPAQQPAANDNAQQARAAQQNNPNPIFTVKHTLGDDGYNLENAPAMNRTSYEGTHIFTGYGPNYNQSIEMDTEQTNEDKFVFKNIPEVKIFKGNQHYTFDNERVVRVKRSGSIDENDGQLHIDRNGNVRTNGLRN